MPGYKPPSSKDIPFKFTDTGYAKPTYNPTNADFSPEYTTADLKSAIQVMGIYQESTYTYKKHCPTYVVGYSPYGVQILKGPCVYGGIRDLGIFIEGKAKDQGKSDLGAFLKRIQGQESYDLSVLIKVYEHLNLSAHIHGFDVRYLSAIIRTHPPENLIAHLNVFQRTHTDLPSNIYGWQASDLHAYLTGVVFENIPASVYGIPPRNLPAYLKVWPEDYLYASVYGWAKLDLAARIHGKPYRELGAYIGAHPWVNVTARIKGWARRVAADLSGYITAFQYRELSAYIYSYEFKNLIVVIYPIPYVPLQGIIHGWQEAYLPAILNGKDYPYNLTASVIATGGLKNLSANIKSYTDIGIHRDLSISIHSWETTDLSSYVYVETEGILYASLFVNGASRDISASIRPKMIRLTTVLGMITLNSRDISAMINVSCLYSKFSNLSAYIKNVYKGDIGGYIRGLANYLTLDIGASTGPRLTGKTLDKLPITITVKGIGAQTYDRFPIHFKLFESALNLGANIVGTAAYLDLGSTIQPVYITNYSFKHYKNKEKVYKPRKFGRGLELSKVVEFTFRDAVKEYVYLSQGDKAFALNFLEKWVMNVKGFSPINKRLGTKRKLFRAAVLYDIRKYKDMDEAVRDMIEFVTWEPQVDLGAKINLIHNSMFKSLNANISARYIKSDQTLISASIESNIPYPVVVANEQAGIDIVE